MTENLYRGYKQATEITIKRADVAKAIAALAQQFLDTQLILPHELDVPTTADPARTEQEVLRVLEDSIWAALCDHLEDCKFFQNTLEETFNTHDALGAAMRVFREDRHKATVTEQVQTFIAEAKAAGYSGVAYRSTLDSKPRWELRPAGADNRPAQDFNSPECLERIVEICMAPGGPDIPHLP
jgi:hypothetical protein